MGIMAEFKILTVHQLVMKESIQFIHKILTNKSPGVIFNLVSQSNCKMDNIREVKKFRVKVSHKLNKVTNSLYYRALYLFNCLETEVRTYKVKKSSKYLQDNLKYIFPYNKIPKLQ